MLRHGQIVDGEPTHVGGLVVVGPKLAAGDLPDVAVVEVLCLVAVRVRGRRRDDAPEHSSDADVGPHFLASLAFQALDGVLAWFDDATDQRPQPVVSAPLQQHLWPITTVAEAHERRSGQPQRGGADVSSQIQDELRCWHGS